MAVDWMGNVPSDDLGALLGVNTASTSPQFKAALAGWHAPTQNFVYADTAGNIGVIAPGYYPQVAGRLPAVAADAGHRRVRHHRGDPRTRRCRRPTTRRRT